MTAPMLLRADWVLTAAGEPALRDGAVRVERGRIASVGPAAAVQVEGAEVIDLGPAVLMPGLVNAHQHGRGVSQLLMGYPDAALEPWIAGRRRHGPPDLEAVTRTAAEAMLANGVTATLHSNYAYGSGDYEAELRTQIAAYQAAGLRATVCVGLQDQGGLVYPGATAQDFLASLGAGTRALVARPAPPPYMADWQASVALMDRLQALFAGDDLIRFAWGPAGPQWVSDELWSNLASDAAARAVGVHFHLLESPAQAEAARRLYPEGTLARLRALGVFAARTSCAHGVRMTPDDMALAATEGMTVVLNPGSNMRLFNGTPPVAALRAVGVRLAVGTDNCALTDDEDHLREVRLTALLSRSVTEEPAERETAALFAMATTGGAAAAFLPDGYGRITPGAPADLAAFRTERITGDLPLPDDRLAELLFARGSGADCVLTMVAGTVRFAARAQDRARIAKWQEAAKASVAARVELAPADAVLGLQAGLRTHYAARAGI
jgi:cytosine/adenosine deaminase-related metal-dependent hydrolase